MKIDFKMNPYHFFDEKLLSIKSDTLAYYNWQNILEERKKIFTDYSFIVIDNDNGVIFTDFFIGCGFNEEDIKFNFDSEAPKRIYCINIQNGFKKTHLCFENDINLIHESLITQTSQARTYLKFKSKSVYTNIIKNNSTGTFEQNLQIKSFSQTDCYFLQKNTNSKNKVNQKHYLSQEQVNVNILVLNKIQVKQLRDDFIEFEHSCSNTKSELKYFSINGGKSVSQINSFIPEEVVNCETHQHIKHILISDVAQSYSKPNLMIKNPYVIASHGNSIGSYNDDEIFYLMQKGITLELAKKIIQDGIINQALESHPDYEKIKGYFNE